MYQAVIISENRLDEHCLHNIFPDVIVDVQHEANERGDDILHVSCSELPEPFLKLLSLMKQSRRIQGISIMHVECLDFCELDKPHVCIPEKTCVDCGKLFRSKATRCLPCVLKLTIQTRRENQHVL